MKYIDDERYQKAAEKEIERIDSHENAVKKKKEYVKQYQIKNNFIAKKQKHREENREAYNSYMREYFKRKRAERRAQKEQAGKNQGEITDTPDTPTT